MPDIVIIPTAGIGSRMGELTTYLNKALMPYKGEPILSHIISKFPKDSIFLIPIGYLGDQIIDFCKLAYSDLNITFVKIDNWSGELSGTAHTFKQCIPYIDRPFWYVTCDTYFNEDISVISDYENVFFVKDVSIEDSNRYTMFKRSGNRCCAMNFKQTRDKPWTAFTGLMKINAWQPFIKRISSTKSIEIIDSLPLGSLIKDLNSWIDFGTKELYLSEVAKDQKFDFSKFGEQTWIANKTVIKWWYDSSIATKKYERSLIGPTPVCTRSGSMISYQFVDGNTFYKENDKNLLRPLLNWLKESVWVPPVCDIDLSDACKKFYKEKSIARINDFLCKNMISADIESVNGIAVKKWFHYFESIDWNLLISNNYPVWIHGDCQFDNIIITNEKQFIPIDWRHEFGNEPHWGDAYYDIAKLFGGCLIDYSKIKNGEFSFNRIGNDVTISQKSIDDVDYYRSTILDFCRDNKLNTQKVLTLVPLIFWNMAPLHTKPFDEFLWALGLQLFEIFKTIINEKNH